MRPRPLFAAFQASVDAGSHRPTTHTSVQLLIQFITLVYHHEQVLGQVGALPDVFSELEINFFLLRRLLGVRSKEGEKQSKVRGRNCMRACTTGAGAAGGAAVVWGPHLSCARRHGAPSRGRPSAVGRCVARSSHVTRVTRVARVTR